MASAPLNWLLKIGSTALKTTAQTLTGAVNELKDSISSLQSQISSQLSAVAADMSKKVNKTDVLNLEEIEATTDLTDKVAAAEAVKEVNDSLQADNGQSFRFAYDSVSGKYGYKAEVEGADTFFPFSTGCTVQNGFSLSHGDVWEDYYRTFTYNTNGYKYLLLHNVRLENNTGSGKIALTICGNGNIYLKDYTLLNGQSQFETPGYFSVIFDVSAYSTVTLQAYMNYVGKVIVSQIWFFN